MLNTNKYLEILKKHERLIDEINTLDLAKEFDKYKNATVEMAKLDPFVKIAELIIKKENDIADLEEIIMLVNGMELTEYKTLHKATKKELNDLKNTFKKLEDEELKKEDINNFIIEIRSGAGGEEASIFAEEICNMYLMFLKKYKANIEILNMNRTDLGIKEVSIEVNCENVYPLLKREIGVHRVQRIPTTESNGRMQTSTITVYVMPIPKVEKIELKEEDLEITRFRGSGAGGQYRNTTDSCIKIIHKPTGITAIGQNERSQYKNIEFAKKLLLARLYEKITNKQEAEISSQRKEGIGTADRSQKIRTYHYPENRITNHITKKTIYKLDKVIKGDLELLYDEE